MAYTPGTWRYDYDRSFGHCVRSSKKRHSDLTGEMIEIYVAHLLKSREDGLLIAAAPDLLEACKEGLELSKYAAALNFSEDVGNTQEFLDELHKMLDHFQTTARAAIARAEPPH